MSASLLDQCIWVALSVGIAILAGVMNAYAKQMVQRTPADKKWLAILRTPWFIDTLRLLYAISIPALALFFSGILSYRGLGLKPFPWSQQSSEGQTLWLTWQQDFEKTVVVCGLTYLILNMGLRSAGSSKNNPRPGLLTATLSGLQESIIDQVHWTFYRELCIRIWGIARGSWIVAIPLSVELFLNPATWTRLKDQRGINSLVVNCGIFRC